MNKMRLTAIVACGLAMASVAAGASNVPLSDILLGFSSTASPTDFEVDLGSIGTNFSSPGTTFIGNINTQLTSIYGSNWATQSTLTFGAAGYASDTNKTTWATGTWTSTSGTLGVQNSVAPAGVLSSSSLAAAGAKIVTVSNGFSTATDQSAGGLNAVSIAASNSSSYDAQDISNFRYTKFADAGFSQLVTSNNGTYAASDLYKFQKTVAGSFIGTLSLGTNGDVNFTIAAIPEPSVYAALLGVMTVGFVGFRRWFGGRALA